MILMNAILSFIFQTFCLCLNVTYRVGYLCEGEVCGLPSKPINVYGSFDSKFGKNVIFDMLKEQYTLKVVENTPEELSKEGKEKTKKFSYINLILDDDKKYWKEDKKEFFNAFKIVDNSSYKNVQGIRYTNLDKEEFTEEEMPNEILTIAEKYIQIIFTQLFDIYCNKKEEFNLFKKGYMNKSDSIDDENNNSTQDLVLSNNEGFNAKDVFLELLKFFEENDNAVLENKLDFQGLCDYFSDNKIKSLFGISEKNLRKLTEEGKEKNYTKRYYAFMNEASIFFKEKFYAGYAFIDSFPKYKLSSKNVLIFEICFIDPNTTKNEGVSKENANQKISKSDISFTSTDGKSVAINESFISIFEITPNFRLIVVIDKDKLINMKVKLISIKGCNQKFNVEGDLFNSDDLSNNQF